MVGENFGEFGKSKAICQSFTHPNLHLKKLRIVDYQKIHRAKTHTMSILKYFHPLREKPDLPDPSGPLRETVPPTAIVAANVKVNEALNEAELKKSASRARGTYSFLTPAQKYEVGKRAAEYGVAATICHYGIKYPDLVLKENSVHRFKNAYQERIKLNLDFLGAAGLETPGFAKELPNKKIGRPQ